jgi:hypothetical protein
MPLTYKTSAGSGDFKSLPPGTHLAICNLIADLGMQPGSAMYPTPKHQVFIRFEVPAERVQYEKDGKKLDGPIVIGQTFTASMNEKANLRKQLESWLGKAFTDDEAESFDVSTILGKPAMLSVIENRKGDKTYTNIVSISGIPKGVQVPRAENDLLYFAADDTACFAKLPEWLQKKINGQIKEEREPEYQRGVSNDFEGQGITDDDIPF